MSGGTVMSIEDGVRAKFDSLNESYYGPCPPIPVTHERQTRSNTESSLDVRVEHLARELARTINAGVGEEREQLREMAVHVLRDEVELVESVALGEVHGPPPQAYNPFGIAIPLGLVGGVMLILFPPVGLLLFAAAGMMVLWGLASVALSRR